MEAAGPDVEKFALPAKQYYICSMKRQTDG
jgi:hypothetical protein